MYHMIRSGFRASGDTVRLHRLCTHNSNLSLQSAHSKLLIILWTMSLQKQLDVSQPPIPITAISLHPGSVDTFTHKWPLAPLWKLLVAPVVTDIDRGSYTSFFAAAGKDIRDNRDKYKGVYLEDNPTRIANPSKVGRG